jgi:hypothetical protein
MENIAFDFLGRALIGVILYVVLMVVFAIIWFPLCLLFSGFAIWWILKEF